MGSSVHSLVLPAITPLHYNALQRTRKMQDQLTVRLPADLGRALRRASKRLRRKNSDVVRLALQAYLQAEHADGAKPADRVRHLLGSVSSGVPDLTERHREYVLASLKRGR